MTDQRPRATGPKHILGPGDAFLEVVELAGGAMLETIRGMDAEGRIYVEHRRYDPNLEPRAMFLARKRCKEKKPRMRRQR